MLAALGQSSLIRLIPVGMILLALQRTVFVDLQAGGVIIQIVLAFVATAGAVGGSERGAVAGFTLGMMFDLIEGTPLGSTATAFTIAGIVAGLLALVSAEPPWWLLGLGVLFGSAAGEAMVPVVRLFTGEEDPWPPEMLTIVVVVAVSAAVLTPVFVPLARWCLRVRGPAWTAPIDDPT